jgi:hypothetical protein
MIRVVNKRTYSGNGTYIGRPSVLGNPFTHKFGGTQARFIVASREDAVKRYNIYIREAYRDNSSVRDAINYLVKQYLLSGELTLICWCSPKACHGDVLAKLIQEIAATATISDA